MEQKQQRQQNVASALKQASLALMTKPSPSEIVRHEDGGESLLIYSQLSLSLASLIQF